MFQTSSKAFLSYSDKLTLVIRYPKHPNPKPLHAPLLKLLSLWVELMVFIAIIPYRGRVSFKQAVNIDLKLKNNALLKALQEMHFKTNS